MKGIGTVLGFVSGYYAGSTFDNIITSIVDVVLTMPAFLILILIAYEIKIIIEWQWPTGWVSELILWYSVVGILSLLLLHPRQRLLDEIALNIEAFSAGQIRNRV